MNIKSLLLGSAAAMVAVSGAQAADAIVVEPEPVEYVRVCDAYGTGYFFIPGTETCIRLSGFVRTSYEKYYIEGTGTIPASGANAGPNGLDEGVTPPGTPLATATDDVAAVPRQDGNSFDNDFTLWGQRGRLDVRTRNETEWGTLGAHYRLEAGQANNDTDIDMDVALITLGGLRAGFAGANYWASNHGFGNVSAETVSSVAGGAIYVDGYYGFDDATIIDYTFAADGFSVTIGAEDPRISYGQSDGNGGFTGGFFNDTNNGASGNSGNGDVNFYAGFNWSSDFGTLAFTAAHDSIATDQQDGDQGGWAYKVSLSLDLSDFLPGSTLTGYYLNDGDYDTDYLHTGRTTFNPEQIWGVAFDTALNDETRFWVNYWDVEGTDVQAGGLVGAVGGPAANGVNAAGTAALFSSTHNGPNTGDLQQVGVGIRWSPAAAPGFVFDAAYYNGEIDNAIHLLGNTSGATTNVNADFDGFEVTLRRNF